jgi:hypothetical protein
MNARRFGTQRHRGDLREQVCCLQLAPPAKALHVLRSKIALGLILVMGPASQGNSIDRMRLPLGPRLAMVKLQKIARVAATTGGRYECATLAVSF